MARLGMSKKKRFEIFKRDRFTCQYCGASAPDVRLHVDHVKPVAEGGTNDPENLTTACEDCNSGKGAAPLEFDPSFDERIAQAEKDSAKPPSTETVHTIIYAKFGGAFGDEMYPWIEDLWGRGVSISTLERVAREETEQSFVTAELAMISAKLDGRIR